MSKQKRMGTETHRRKQGYPAKAGRRHLVNPNHPRPRPGDQVARMMKSVR